MAWSVPKTWLVGETLSATRFNAIRDNLVALYENLDERFDVSWVPSLANGTSTTYANVGTNPTFTIVLPYANMWVLIRVATSWGNPGANNTCGIRFNVTAPGAQTDATLYELETQRHLTGIRRAVCLIGAWQIASAVTFTVGLQYKVSTSGLDIDSVPVPIRMVKVF